MAVIVGEIANFAAYAFAPAVLVTPLGAVSIIIRQEKAGNDCSTLLSVTFKATFIYLFIFAVLHLLI